MRHASLILCATLIVLSACQQAGARPQSADEVADSPSLTEEAITGEYRVAAIDGEEVAGNIGIALTITERVIWFDPRCAGFSWTYMLEGRTLVLDRPEKPRQSDKPYTATIARPICRIAVHPEKRRLASALDAVTGIERSPSNALELSGNGRSVTLFSQ